MRNIKGLKIDDIVCISPSNNIFSAIGGDVEFVVRQPRRTHIKAHRRAWVKLTDYTKRRYRRRTALAGYYSSRSIGKLPIYRGQVPGGVHLMMIIDDEIVGFADMLFKRGDKFQLYDIPYDDVGCSMNLCVVDKYQGLGIGTAYGYISVFIAKHFGADWTLGNTSPNKGMTNVASRRDWETLGQLPDGNIVIRKKL